MEIGTDKETDRVKVKEKSKDTDKKEARSNSSKSINDAPDDENVKGGNESLQNQNQSDIQRSKEVKEVSTMLSMD